MTAPNHNGTGHIELARTLHKAFSDLVSKAEAHSNLSWALPCLFIWKNQPVDLFDHFVFEPLFAREMPPEIIFKTGRQVGKTMSISLHMLTWAILCPNFRRLAITPLHTHAEIIGKDYIRPLIEASPISRIVHNNTCIKRILERSFTNGSTIRLTYMYTDPTRVRGNPVDAINYDETQDIDLDFMDIANECISHSTYRLRVYTGTPKTLDNPMEFFWQRSSKAEWTIPCPNCKKENICSTEHDLLKMLGPVRPDITEERSGLICASCSTPLNPKKGFWLHGVPSRRYDFPGYHVSQPIIPIHYSTPRFWADLLAKRERLSIVNFKREVLGESEEVGVKLVSRNDLIRAAVLGPNTEEHFEKIRPNYDFLIAGVDWGGGGESGISRTTIAIVGYSYGKVHVVRGIRLDLLDPFQEIVFLKDYCAKHRIPIIAHDANPSGSLREILLHKANISDIIPIQYVGQITGKLLVRRIGKAQSNMRRVWRLHKSRSLQILCAAIKSGEILFFDYTDDRPDGPNLLVHFLSLFEERIENPRGEDQYLIQRNPALSDDFVHAVNFACVALWELRGLWPEFTQAFSDIEELPAQL